MAGQWPRARSERSDTAAQAMGLGWSMALSIRSRISEALDMTPSLVRSSQSSCSRGRERLMGTRSPDCRGLRLAPIARWYLAGL